MQAEYDELLQCKVKNEQLLPGFAQLESDCRMHREQVVSAQQSWDVEVARFRKECELECMRREQHVASQWQNKHTLVVNEYEIAVKQVQTEHVSHLSRTHAEHTRVTEQLKREHETANTNRVVELCAHMHGHRCTTWTLIHPLVPLVVMRVVIVLCNRMFSTVVLVLD